MKCTDLLMQDHRIILSALDVLQQMAIHVENGEQTDGNDVLSLLHFLRAFADEQHHLKEESALFPELTRTSQAQGGPLRHMLFEHDQERSLVEGLEDALRTKNNAKFVLFANRLTSRVRDHIHKEDSVLFPIVKALLSTDQDEKVAAEFAQYEIDAGLLADLQDLECRYVRRRTAAGTAK